MYRSIERKPSGDITHNTRHVIQLLMGDPLTVPSAFGLGSCCICFAVPVALVTVTCIAHSLSCVRVSRMAPCSMLIRACHVDGVRHIRSLTYTNLICYVLHRSYDMSAVRSWFPRLW